VISEPGRAVVFQRETATRDGKDLDVIAAVDFEIHHGKITKVTVYKADTYQFDEFLRRPLAAATLFTGHLPGKRCGCRLMWTDLTPSGGELSRSVAGHRCKDCPSPRYRGSSVRPARLLRAGPWLMDPTRNPRNRLLTFGGRQVSELGYVRWRVARSFDFLSGTVSSRQVLAIRRL